MKRVFILLTFFISAITIWSQGLFESASDSVSDTSNSQSYPAVSFNGYARGSVYGSGEKYDLAYSFAEIALQTHLSAGKAFLQSDIRLRKGVFFNSNAQSIQVKELYAGYKSNKLDVLLGNQIVTWGRTDGFNPTNNITPNDYFFLSANPDDQKKSNFMLRAKYRFIPEIEFDLIGIPFFEASDYRYDLFDMGSNVSFGNEVMPSDQLKNGTVAARLNFDFPAAGWSVSYFNGYDPYHGFGVQSVDWSTSSPVITDVSEFYRKTTLGADFSIPVGNLIFRGEGAYNITDNPDSKMYIPNTDLSYVGGIELDVGGFTFISQYIGKYIPDFKALTVPVISDPTNPLAQMQYANEIIDYQNRLFNRRIFNQQKKTNHAASIAITRSFAYDTWQVECAGYYNFTSEEWLVRPKLTWKINDNLSASLGANYMKGPSQTLFSYSSTVLNGGFLELKASF